MWFKKKAYISGYNSNTAVNGTDWRTSGNGSGTWLASDTLPSAADAGKYFYLPLLGYYLSGKLYVFGHGGHYWSSSAYPGGSGSAFILSIAGGFVSVYNSNRYYGHRVGGFQ